MLFHRTRLHFAELTIGGPLSGKKLVAFRRVNRVDPFAYLVHILDRLAVDSNGEVDLLPNRWRQCHPEAELKLNRPAWLGRVAVQYSDPKNFRRPRFDDKT